MTLNITVETYEQDVNYRGLAEAIAKFLGLPSDAPQGGNAAYVSVSTEIRSMADYWQSAYR